MFSKTKQSVVVCGLQVSEAIIEEEDEQVNVDRNIDEIDEQMYVHSHGIIYN